MARALDTTLFVKNGPCMAGLGLGGEGYLSFSIATPTGEGITQPAHVHARPPLRDGGQSQDLLSVKLEEARRRGGMLECWKGLCPRSITPITLYSIAPCS